MRKCSVCGVGHNSGSICPSEKYKEQFICVTCCQKCKHWKYDKRVHIWYCHLRKLKSPKPKTTVESNDIDTNYNFLGATEDEEKNV